MELMLSKKINQYRREKGMTQEELAAALGVTPQAVSNWERGGYPDITLLPALANFFGVTIDALMGNDELTREGDLRNLFARRNALGKFDNEARLNNALFYYRKYPNDWMFINQVRVEAYCTLWNCPEKREEYLPLFQEVSEKLMDTENRTKIASDMAKFCDEDALEDWLSRCSVNSTTPKATLMARYYLLRDVHRLNRIRGLDWYEKFCALCAENDYLTEDADKYRMQLALLDTLRIDGVLPDGWVFFYARNLRALAGLLLSAGNEEGWAVLRQAMEMYERWFAIPDGAKLDLGGKGLMADWKVVKPGGELVCEGNDLPEHIRDVVHYLGETPDSLHHFLSVNAQFDSVREDERFRWVLDWLAEQMEGKW